MHLFFQQVIAMPDSVMVALLTLTQSVWVQILVRQPTKPLKPQRFGGFLFFVIVRLSAFQLKKGIEKGLF